MNYFPEDIERLILSYLPTIRDEIALDMMNKFSQFKNDKLASLELYDVFEYTFDFHRFNGVKYTGAIFFTKFGDNDICVTGTDAYDPNCRFSNLSLASCSTENFENFEDINTFYAIIDTLLVKGFKLIFMAILQTR